MNTKIGQPALTVTEKNRGLLISLLFLTVFVEGVLIYLFALKELGLIGIILIGIVGIGLSMFFTPWIGAMAIIGFIFSNLGPLIGGGFFSILLFYIIFALLINKFMNGESFSIHQINTAIAVFTVLVLISLVTARDKVLAMEHFVQYIKCLLVFFCIVNLINTKKILHLAYTAIVFASTTLALFSIHKFLSSGISGLRIEGVTRDPNYLSLILVPAIPLAIAVIKTNKNVIIRSAMILSIVFNVTTVLMTYSRGGVVALVVTFIWILYDNRRYKIFSVILIVIFLMLVYLFLTKFSHHKKILHLIAKDGSFMQRMLLYKGGVKMIIANPIFGVGLGNFLIWSTHYTGLVSSLVAHNIFIQVGAETGLPGLAAFLLIIGISWFAIRHSQTLSNRIRNNQLIHLSVGLKISLFSFIVGSLFLTSHFDYALWILLAMAIALENITLQQLEKDVAV